MIDRYYVRALSGLRDEGYCVHDARRREQDPVARVKDPEDAERIARLLSADARRIEQQGAKVA